MIIQSYVHEFLKILSELGIDILDKEEKLTNIVCEIYDKIDEDDFNKESFEHELLETIGCSIYNEETKICMPVTNKVFTQAMEVEIKSMYTNFLNSVSLITEGDIEITDIEEDISKVDMETGNGIHSVRFKCDKKDYKFDGKSHYDWFDESIISFMNNIFDDKKSEKFLYTIQFGYYSDILFYNTEKWAEQFKEKTNIKYLEKL